MFDHFVLLRRRTLPRIGELQAVEYGHSALWTDEIELSPRATAPDGRSDPSIIAAAPLVPIVLVRPVASSRGSGPLSTWGLTAIESDVSALTGDGIDVAILDTGIDATHEAFAGCTIIERDFVGGPGGDPNGHGTHCAGTFFGRSCSGTRIGVAAFVLPSWERCLTLMEWVRPLVC